MTSTTSDPAPMTTASRWCTRDPLPPVVSRSSLAGQVDASSRGQGICPARGRHSAGGCCGLAHLVVGGKHVLQADGITDDSNWIKYFLGDRHQCNIVQYSLRLLLHGVIKGSIIGHFHPCNSSIFCKSTRCAPVAWRPGTAVSPALICCQ